MGPIIQFSKTILNNLVQPQSRGTASKMKRRILFIEDHDDTLELVTMVLQAGEYSVTSASTAAAGLCLAETDTFDLYLLDNWLPDGNGYELCERIREFDSTTPILFYSGAAFDSDKLTAIQAGAQGYLAKPCPFSDLLSTMAVLIAKADRRPVCSEEIHDLVA